MRIKPLRNILTLQSLLAILAPFGFVLLIGLLWVAPQIRKDAETRQLLLARAVGIQVESYLEAGASIVRGTAALSHGGQSPPAELQQRLAALLNATTSMSSLYTVRTDGAVTAMSLNRKQQAHQLDLTGINLSRNALFQKVTQSGGSFWSETFLSVVNGGLTVAYGVKGAHDVVIGEVDLGILSKFLARVGSDNDVMILIIDHTGQIVADNGNRFTAQQLNIGNIPLVAKGIRSDQLTTGRFTFAGSSMTGSIIQIPSIDWHVLVARTDASLYGTPLTMALVTLGGMLVAILFSVITSIVLARKLAGRFESLINHARDIAQGEGTGGWPASTIAEFNQLSMDLQQMALRLQDSEILYRTLFDQLPDGVVLWEVPLLRPLQFNTAAHSMLGYTREEFSRLTVTDLDVVQNNDTIGGVLDTIRREGTASFDTIHRTKNGELRHMLVTLRMIELASQQMILALHRDVTAHKQAEQSLQETKELFTLFMQYSPVYTYIKEIDGGQSRVVEISDNFIEMVGRPASELRGRTMHELFPAEFAEKITNDDLAIVREGKAIQLDEDLRGKHYTTIKFPIYREGKHSLIAGFTIDISDRKHADAEREKLERQLLHAQKLESLGVLAGGIAHDFNNILMAIMGNADLALMRINKESPAVDNLHKIEQAAARAADLAKQMLAYSGKGKFVVENIDLNRLLEDMLHMLEVSISKKAVLRLHPYHPLPSVEADATQIRQIIMNLVINASEAIGDRSGVIAITTGCMDCDNSYLKDVWLDENITEGLYVYLEIADTGCGMDKDTLAKLFDPFFTTKFTGRGLGMAAVLGIIRGHKGAIKVYSEPGKGTSFKILLPASSRPAELFNHAAHKDNWQGKGAVLLVDDEETVRGIGSEMLKELGFTPLTANDGREAVEIFKNRPDIVFVILDLTMPHMDGEQCFRELRRMNPDVKVIMSSGYNEQEVTQKFVGKGLAGFIQKPYRLSVLKDAIREIENGRSCQGIP